MSWSGIILASARGDSGSSVVDCNPSKVYALVIGQVKSAPAGLFRTALIIDMVDVRDDTTGAMIEAAKSTDL